MDVAPLSDAQHRMWLHQKLHNESTAYNVCIRLDLGGNLDETRLLEALTAIVERHEILRTTYPTAADGQPYQRIHAQLTPPVHVVEHGDPERVARVAACTPFDITSFGPIRIHLVKVNAALWSLVLTVHHIVWDGGCFGIFSRDLSLAYRGVTMEPLSVQYADIAAHQNSSDARSVANLDRQLAYWRQILTPLPPVLPLPTVHTRGPRMSEQATRQDRVMPTSCAIRLRTAAATLGTTPFVVFIAAYTLLLHRWTGALDITIGTMVANRHLPGSRELIGNFGNTVLLRIHVSMASTFHDLVKQTARIVTDAISHGDVSFEKIIADIAPPREAGHGFFTDTLGLFLDRDIGGPDLPGVDVRWTNIFNGASPFALTFQGFLTGDVLQVEAMFRSELFAPETVFEMLEHLESILLQATANPTWSCSIVSELPGRQRERLMQLARGAEVEQSTDAVIEHWRRHVKRKPSNLALVHGTDRYSFMEIDEQANRLAAHLMERGIHAQDVVAVVAGRGLTTLVAPLAIWKCGAIYVPLDPGHPPARRQKFIQITDAKLVICGGAFTVIDVPFVCVDPFLKAPRDQAPDPGYHPRPQEAACIGFTSGSTGQPKGVVITHGSLMARTSWVPEYWPGGVGGARLAKSTPAAIDATAELCEAFVTGEYIVLATDSEAKDAAALAHLLKIHGIGHLMAVPGLIEAITIAAPDAIMETDRILSTGEPLLPGVATSIHREVDKGVPLHNSYGCTETTGDVTTGKISLEDAERGMISIGRPLPGSRCYVLAADLTLSPPGSLGELYVEGPQLARGYFQQSSLTATRFVANPFNENRRLYRTGDLARWSHDGRLELAGRIDDQVNIRGHRVEPDETVAELHATPGVKEAIVLPRAIGTTMELVAYVAGDELQPQDGARLRARLADRLPGPLVPAEVIVLIALPRLDGGKIDRQALPKNASALEIPFRSARNEHEACLVRLLSDLLGGRPISIDDNFFALGGDSLITLSFAARATAAGFDFPAAAVFQFPTIAQLVDHFPPQIKARSTPATLPSQIHRLRLSGLPIEECITWEALRSPASPAHLRAALTDAISRHSFLQQKIAARGKLWRATQTSGPSRAAQVIELPSSDAAEIVEAARSTIDVSTGNVLAGIVTPDISLLIAHAAVIDGVSLAQLADNIDRHLSTGRADTPCLPSRADQDHASIHPYQIVSSGSFDWQAVLDTGQHSPWWVGADEPLPKSPNVRIRASMAGTPTGIVSALLTAACNLSQSDLVIADMEMAPDEIGPMFVVPISTKVGYIADIASYLAYLNNRRPVAGGPGLLIRRTVTPPPLSNLGVVRGTDRLYRIVTAWQQVEDRIVLEVATDQIDSAQALLDAWITELSGRRSN